MLRVMLDLLQARTCDRAARSAARMGVPVLHTWCFPLQLPSLRPLSDACL